jgi:hypothetical protein
MLQNGMWECGLDSANSGEDPVAGSVIKHHTGRKTLYSVGGGWMNEYGALVEWY